MTTPQTPQLQPVHPPTRILEIKEFIEIIPKFDGKINNLSSFILESEKIINQFYNTLQHTPDNEYIMGRIKSKIVGEAAIYLNSQCIRNWEELKFFLITSYGDKRDDFTLTFELMHITQNREDALSFYKKIQEHLSLLNNYITLHKNNSLILQNFVRGLALKTFLFGLKDPLGQLLRTKDPQTLEEALCLLNNTFNKEVSKQNFLPFQTQQNSKPNYNFSSNQNFNNRKNPFNPKFHTNYNTPTNNVPDTPRPDSHTRQPIIKTPFRSHIRPQARNFLQKTFESAPSRTQHSPTQKQNFNNQEINDIDHYSDDNEPDYVDIEDDSNFLEKTDVEQENT